MCWLRLQPRGSISIPKCLHTHIFPDYHPILHDHKPCFPLSNSFYFFLYTFCFMHTRLIYVWYKYFILLWNQTIDFYWWNCWAETCNLYLSAYQSPVSATIMIPPSNTTVVSPSPAVFTCVADGVLTPVITWWRQESDNSLTQLSSDGVNITITEDNLDSRTRQSNLTVLQPQPVDATEYVCVASNELATDMASAVLTVYGRYSWFELQCIIHTYTGRR